MLHPGDAIDGRYRVLGSDGSATSSWLIEHETLRSVHVLVVLPVQAPEAVARLLTGGRAWAALRHPNIVAVTDAMVIDGHPALVVEHVQGPTLAERLAAGPLPLDEALACFDGVLAGVVHAHAHGLVHQDLHAGAVRLATVGGQTLPKVEGFGVARVLAEVQGSATARSVASATWGTPEQLGGAPVGPATDVFALGNLLYTLVCGVPPFAGPDRRTASEAIAAGRYVDPLDHRPDLPDAVVQAIRAALQPAPERRPASAEALAALLRGAPSPSPLPAPPPPRRSRTFPLVIGGAAVAVVLLFAWDRTRLVEREVDAVFRRGAGFDVGPDGPGPGPWRVWLRGGEVVELLAVDDWGDAAHLYADARFDAPDAVPVHLRRVDADADGSSWEVLHLAGDPIQRLVVTLDGGVREERYQTLDGEPTEGLLPRDPAQPGDRLAVYAARFTLDADGWAREGRWLDRSGQPMADPVGAFGLAWTRDTDGRPLTVSTLDAAGRVGNDRTGTATWRNAYEDPRHPGRATRTTREDFAGRSRGGESIRLDERGRVVARASFDGDGDPSPRTTGAYAGCATVTWTFYAASEVIACFDAAGEPTATASGWTRRQELRSGGRITLTHLDAEGHPVVPTDRPFQLEYTFDALGRIIRKGPAHGPDGEQVPLDDSGLGHVTWTHDERSYPAEERRFDLDGAPRRIGTARTRYEHDDQGRLVRIRRFDAEDQPVRGTDGWAVRELAYEGGAFIATERLLDPRGDPTVGADGWAILRWTRDERGFNRSYAAFGPDEEPVVDTSTGCSKQRYDRDARGNLVGLRCLGPEGEPVLSPTIGYSISEQSFDINGRVIEERYFNERGEPLGVDPLDAAIQRSTWDDRGLRLTLELFGADGLPIPSCARIVRAYDDAGRDARLACEGVTGRPEPFPQWPGVHAWEWSYDPLGRLIEERAVGPDGALVDGPAGFARTAWSYAGVRSEPIERRDFLASGAPAPGIARLTLARDAQGRPVDVASWGPSGEPAATGTHAGMVYSRQTTVYDAAGRPTVQRYFGLDGALVQPACCAESTHDVAGHFLRVAWTGPDGARALLPEGYSAATSRYDEAGQRVEAAFFGVDDEPVSSAGYHRAVYTHDALGREIRADVFGVDGKPVLCDAGYASLLTAYDERGRVVDVRTLGPDGRPVRAPEGHAREATVYDRQDHVIEQRWFDEEGRPVNRVEGWARRTHRYDAFGRLIEEAAWDAEDRPVLLPGGYASRSLSWRRDGRVDEEIRRGVDGRMLPAPDGGWPAP